MTDAADKSTRSVVALAALAAIAAPDLLAEGYGELKSRVRSAMANDPMDTTLATVLVGSWLFYEAEKEHNPKVNSFGDAFVFISTCLSVGYSDIFARTEAGKAIATAVMTFGPAMAASILDKPNAQAPVDVGHEMLAAQRDVVSKLEAILNELKARG